MRPGFCLADVTGSGGGRTGGLPSWLLFGGLGAIVMAVISIAIAMSAASGSGGDGGMVQLAAPAPTHTPYPTPTAMATSAQNAVFGTKGGYSWLGRQAV